MYVHTVCIVQISHYLTHVQLVNAKTICLTHANFYSYHAKTLMYVHVE